MEKPSLKGKTLLPEAKNGVFNTYNEFKERYFKATLQFVKTEANAPDQNIPLLFYLFINKTVFKWKHIQGKQPCQNFFHHPCE